MRRAFRALVRRYHPDANPGARPGGQLSAVVEAYRQVGRRAAVAPAQAAATAPRHIDVYA